MPVPAGPLRGAHRLRLALALAGATSFAFLAATAPATCAAEPVKPVKASASKAPATKAKDGPETVVVAYGDALRSGDWTKAAGLLHPEALAEAHGVLTALAASDPSGDTARQLFALGEGETVETLAPGVLFARFMGELVEHTPGLSALLSSTRARTLGSVSEGELVHVVYRMSREADAVPAAEQIEVMTLKKAGGTWHTMLPSEIQGILASIRNSLAEREAANRQQPLPPLDLDPSGDTPPPSTPPPSAPSEQAATPPPVP